MVSGNRATVRLGQIVLHVHYESIVAFQFPAADGSRIVVRQNEWGASTEKFLNQIDGGSDEAKSARLSTSRFESALVELSRAFAWGVRNSTLHRSQLGRRWGA